MKYEVIIIWTPEPDKQIIECESYEDAKKTELAFKEAFGNQIEWSGIRERR